MPETLNHTYISYTVCCVCVCVCVCVYVPHGCESKTGVAVRALKDCMVFDEQEYGRVCDVNQVRAVLAALTVVQA